MTSFPSHPLNPEKAIWDKDIKELARALEAGWRLPFVHVKDGMVQDFSLAIRIISLRWVEGWLLLAHHMPSLHAENILWQLALKRGVAGVVRSFLEHGQSATSLLERGILPLHLTAEGFGPLHGEPIPEEELVETVRILVAHGGRLSVPCPGQVVGIGMSAPQGHTFWTRMIHFERFTVAKDFLPETWEEMMAAPRGNQALDVLLSVVRSGKDSAALELWTQFLCRWAPAWLGSNPQESFAMISELPALKRLDRATRHQIWVRWEQVDSTGWTALHDLALSGKTLLAHEVLALAVEEKASCLRLWTHADQEGVRPCDLWEIAKGRDPGQLPAVPGLPLADMG